MKIKVGLKWKSIDGLQKGKYFTVTAVSPKEITYKCDETGNIYTAERKHFERYIQRVNKYWNETNKTYKYKKANMKLQE